MGIAVKQQIETPTMKQQLYDILIEVSWAKIAQQYFGKSSSWIYHKLDGIDGNGGKGEFTAEEKETLKYALSDLATRINTAAAAIK